ncbi:CXXC-rich protein [Entamoeba marina]
MMWWLLLTTLALSEVCINQNTECTHGYYHSGYNKNTKIYTCCECSDNCLQCISGDICVNCEEMYGLFTTKTMVSCKKCKDNHCLVCGEKRVYKNIIESCFSCEGGYEKNEIGLCVNQNNKKPELIVLFVLMVIFIMFVYVIFSLLSHIFKRQRLIKAKTENVRRLDD